MVANYLIEALLPKPGIQKDLTQYSSPYCVEGQWVRFFEGVPMKMLGMQAFERGTPVLVRSMLGIPRDNGLRLYLGRQDSVGYLTVSESEGSLASGPIIYQTPAGYTSRDNALWSFAHYSTSLHLNKTGNQVLPNSYIIAVPTDMASDLTGDQDYIVYYQSLSKTDNMVPIDSGFGTVVRASGCVVSAPPLLVATTGGNISWTYPGHLENWTNSPTVASGAFLNEQNIADSKIIQGYSAPGATDATIIFWSLDQVIRATYLFSDGTSGSWDSQVLQEQSSLMAPNAVVPSGMRFFWPGTTRFYVYNGVVQDLPNNVNSQFFFDYLDYGSRSKVWGFSNPRFNEIWWLWPKKDTPDNPNGTVKECNWALIYNTVENTWYDTPLSRSAGYPPTSFQYPILADSNITSPSSAGNAPIWAHEIGLDQTVSYEFPGRITQRTPILSYFETNQIDLYSSAGNNNRSIRTCRLELDLIQVGDMQLQIKSRPFPRGDVETSQAITFTPSTSFIDDVFSQGRIINFVFSSNSIGGFYQLGKINLDYKLGSIVP